MPTCVCPVEGHVDGVLICSIVISRVHLVAVFPTLHFTHHYMTACWKGQMDLAWCLAVCHGSLCHVVQLPLSPH